MSVRLLKGPVQQLFHDRLNLSVLGLEEPTACSTSGAECSA